MAILLMSKLPARVIQVLQDYLPAELDLIDASLADGITTVDIANADYYDWDIPVIQEYPAVSLRPVSSTPTGKVYTALMGERIDAEHRIDVMFHVQLSDAAQEPSLMLKLLYRYIAGAARVLCVTKEALQTVADPTRYASMCAWVGDAEYGPSVEQEEGALVRTATLPISIRMFENRT